MFLDACKIEYKGLTPNDGVKHKVTDLVQKIQANAPSDSNILMGLEQVGDLLKGSIKISATCGFFEAEAESAKDSLKELCKAIEKDINGQLLSWKKQRFS